MLIDTTLFVRDGMYELAGTGIDEAQAREGCTLRTVGRRGLMSGGVLDPERVHLVVQNATDSMLHAIHTLGLMMAAVPVAAIAAALVLLRPPAKHGSADTHLTDR